MSCMELDSITKKIYYQNRSRQKCTKDDLFTYIVASYIKKFVNFSICTVLTMQTSCSIEYILNLVSDEPLICPFQ